ncbi:hypothetical protein Ccrd_020398, partial [Cynara cardunculus var. scolymus]
MSRRTSRKVEVPHLKGTEAVEVLHLLQKEYCLKVHIDVKAFAHMKNLRILKICDEELRRLRHAFDLKLWKESKVNYHGKLKFLSNKLRLLYWHGFPFKCFPSDFYPENIVAIDLSYSHIKNLWTSPKVLILTQISFLLQFIEFPSNTRGIFGGQDDYDLDIQYHGNRIPQWFIDTSMGNHLHVNLPPDFCYNKLRGFGFCVVLTPKRSCGHKYDNDTPRYHVDNFDGTSLAYRLFYCSYGIPKSDIIWFGFETLVSREWKEAKNFVTFWFEDDDDFEVKECGFRLVFDEDIEEETNFSLIQELPTPTQEG